MMIDSYLLKYFLAFYEEGSLLRASEKLNLSQPSLTRAMQKLESELGIKIFERSVNKIALNENGKILVDYARDILALNNLLEQKAKELKQKELLIHVAMTAPGIMYYYPHFFFDNRERCASKIVDASACIKEVKEGLVDISFINKEINEDGLICEKIMDEKLYVCLPKEHFLAQKASVTYKELDGQSFLLGNELGVWDDIVKRRLSKSKFFKLEQDSLSEVAKYSSIPSFVTDISMKLDNREGKMIIPIEGEETMLPFYVLYRDGKKKIYDFIRLIR